MGVLLSLVIPQFTAKAECTVVPHATCSRIRLPGPQNGTYLTPKSIQLATVEHGKARRNKIPWRMRILCPSVCFRLIMRLSKPALSPLLKKPLIDLCSGAGAACCSGRYHGMAWVMRCEMAGSLALAEGSGVVPGSRGRGPGFPVHNDV